MKSYHPLENLLQLNLPKICHFIMPKKHLHQPHVFLRLSDVLRTFRSSIFSFHYKKGRKFKEYSKKTKRKIRSFISLSNALSLSCARFVRDNLITRISQTKNFHPKGFYPYAHHYYHMYVSGHKIEDCKS